MKKLNSLDILSSMQEAQMIQFQAATTLVIGTIMRKVGLTELSVEPEDIDAIVTGETLRIEALPNGGFKYSFHTPVVATQAADTSESDPDTNTNDEVNRDA